MSSQLDISGLTDKPQIYKHNRARLMQQNKKLLVEIHKLDQVISKMIQKTVAIDFQVKEQNQQLKQKYKKQQNLQLKTIARLKKQIKIAKSNTDMSKYQTVKQQQNQVTFLKKQYEKYLIQRDTLAKKKVEKQQALQYYKPLNNQAANTSEKYKKIKSQNNQLRLKINQLEKQLNQYHKIKQLAKSSVPKESQNINYSLLNIDKQISEMKKQMKRIDEKWKGQIETLDKQYFGFKNILTGKNKDLESIQKQSKNWQYKSMNYRDQDAVAHDRQRVNSVIISPQKRKQMQDIIADSKNRGKKPEPKPLENKSKLAKKPQQKIKSNTTYLTQVQVITPTKQKSQQLEDHNKQKQQLKQQRQHTPLPESGQKRQEQKKVTKIMQSVGVGTSFYYNDE